METKQLEKRCVLSDVFESTKKSDDIEAIHWVTGACVLSFPVDGKERECEVGREKKDNNEEKYKDKDNDKDNVKYI